MVNNINSNEKTRSRSKKTMNLLEEGRKEAENKKKKETKKIRKIEPEIEQNIEPIVKKPVEKAIVKDVEEVKQQTPQKGGYRHAGYTKVETDEETQRMRNDLIFSGRLDPEEKTKLNNMKAGEIKKLITNHGLVLESYFKPKK
jgi:hypothetical protein